MILSRVYWPVDYCLRASGIYVLTQAIARGLSDNSMDFNAKHRLGRNDTVGKFSSESCRCFTHRPGKVADALAMEADV